MAGFIEFVQTWWVALTTLLLPFLVQLIAQVGWSGSVKRWVALGVSAVVGVLAAFNAGVELTPETLTVVVLAVAGGTQLCYALFRSVGITNKWLDALLQVLNRTKTDAPA